MSSSTRKENSVMGSQRRRRTRARKPRYVSLRRELARFASPEPARMAADGRHRQLDLFPLHPEPIHRDPHNDHDEDEDDREGKYAAKFFDLECDTLNSILGSIADPEQEEVRPSQRSHDAANPSEGLARRALKGRERWQFCNNEEEEEEEGEGSSGGGGTRDLSWDAPRGLLCLKLNYEEIMTAWSDKGPLYVDGEGAQVVPCDSHQHHLYEPPSVFVDVAGGSATGGNNSSSCSSNLWMVPENGEGSGGGDREARVMRYREKRQSRLFAKKIRYEVRKLNAEKRPRVKGRFVKRVEVK